MALIPVRRVWQQHRMVWLLLMNALLMTKAHIALDKYVMLLLRVLWLPESRR